MKSNLNFIVLHRQFMIKHILLVLLSLFLALHAYSNKPSTVVIGVYEWFNQNLNVTHFRNGDPIPQAKTEEEWKAAAKNGTPAWCYYNNDPASAREYGLLYNWYAVNDVRGLAPVGWHIPTRQALQSLLAETGDHAGRKLKSEKGWTTTTGGTNEKGFGAIPAGVRYIGGLFHDQGKYAYYWTGTDKRADYALYFSMGYKHDQVDSTDAFSYLKKGTGMSVRCVRRVTYDGFEISPDSIPNDGVMFVDHESTNRSGHYGSALTTCKNGDILAFYTNVSGSVLEGHGIAGWSEYKRSTDGGKSWEEPVILEYTKRMWDLNKISSDRIPEDQNYFAARATAVITAPNGTIVAFISRQWANNQNNYIGFKPPVYLLSYDNGRTWTEPRAVDPIATTRDISLTNEDGASFVYDGVIYTVFIGGHGGGEYSLYASHDNGESFTKVSGGLFKNKPYKKSFFYMSAKALDDGRFVVYAYNIDDELNLPYVISDDRGKTWSDVKTTYMSKRIRGAQLSEKIGDYYFMVGRSGSYGDDPLNLVLYASKNGIDWDDGRYLNKVQKGLDSYSAIEVFAGEGGDSPSALIQATIAYGVGASVNIKHWWIKNIEMN